MTQQEWDTKWMMYYDSYWLQTKSHQKSFEIAHRAMTKKYGPRPVGEPGPPIWLKLTALVAGDKMAAFLKVISRFGPLIAAFLVGLGGVIPGATPIVDGVVSALGFLGIKPDAESAALFANLAASVLLLYGSVVKGYKLIRDKFFPPKE